MKRLVISVVTLALCSLASQGALTVLEDFEALTLGTIDQQHQITEFGFDVLLWKAQANRGERYDSGWANVVEEGAGGGQCVKLTNRDRGGEIDTVYVSFYLGDANAITTTGTIYLQYKADGPNDTIMCTNDLYDGFGTDVEGDDIGEEDVYQGTTNYAEQASLVRISGDEDFRARADGSYHNVDMGLAANVWNEMWIQVDVAAKSVKYYVCEAGGTPTVVINPATSGEWWGWRNDGNTAVYNLKWMVGMYPWPDADTETNVLIDNIAIELDAYTTESLWADKYPGDCDGDCDVDITDFLILKGNYNTQTGATWEMGDFNGDEAVTIADFLILKGNYGTSCDD